GFYPDCPGSPEYTLTTPTFDKVTIKLDKKYYKNDELVIEKKGKNPSDIYIKDMKLDGKPLKKYRIDHKDLVEGNKLIFELK
ncbi:MAG: glycoside hydrolase domain-containing protein, partial [Bacteroidales bacterium]